MEKFIREKVKRAKTTATVFTGGLLFEVTTYISFDDRFLANEFNFFWKIIIINNRGLAFFTYEPTKTRNKWLSKYLKNICTNLCPQESFVCCGVQEFKSGTKKYKSVNWPEGSSVEGNLDWF
jgi:hypothetical protein